MIQGACRRICLASCYSKYSLPRSLPLGTTRLLASKPPAPKAKKILGGIPGGEGPVNSQKLLHKSKETSSIHVDSANSSAFKASQMPVPFFWRLMAVGTTFVAFFVIFKPFAPPEKQGEGKGSRQFLQPTQFVKCVVHSVEASVPSEPLKEQVSSTTHGKPSSKPPTQAEHIILQMGIPNHLLPDSNEHLGNAIYHLYIKDDDMQVERPYTPINGIGIDGKFALWIKRYQGGEVSNWLARLNRGRNIEIRGIVRQWDWREKDVDEIVMVSSSGYNDTGLI
jgi:hypothetical protein